MESSDGHGRSDIDRGRTNVAQRRFDPGGHRELTSAIVFAVADAEGVDPAEMGAPPLYESVDACSLDDVLFGARDSTPTDGRVEFEYRGYLVTVREDGWIRVFDGSERG